MGIYLYRSTDGGDSWSEVGSSNHVDHHALVFDPTNPSRIFEGNDGGVYVSTNSGAAWTKLYNQPTNQFYAIEIDYLNPERLYGGTQDNGTLRTLTGAIDDWEMIFGGDGFYCIVDPTNSDVIYAEYQFGNLYKSTDLGYTWSSALDGVGSDRVNWMMPVVMDPTDNRVLYLGTYRVYKTVDGAGWWDPISGDLTDGDHGGGFGTITTIAVAPSDPSVIYVGTDDSNVWVTTNGGSSWQNISGSLPNRWVTRVAVDPTDASIAYVTFSGLRWDEDIGYVYRTDDYGSTWTDVTGNLPGAPVNAIVVDPLVPSRIIVGSDVGCFYSEMAGTNWEVLGTGLPPVPVYDLKIHNPTRTLVAGTHGRSMYSFDLGTLPDVSGVAARWQEVVTDLRAQPNPFRNSTTIVFSLSRSSHVAVAVYDLTGRKVKTLASGSLEPGIHRLTWDGSNDAGHRVASGIYYVRAATDRGYATFSLNLVR